MKFRLLIVISIISNFLCGQDAYFLDSLFQCDFSSIDNVTYELQKTEIKRLESDLGLSAGVNVTNSFQDQIDAGLSTRVYAKMNLLSNGYYDNRIDSEIIRNQILIDSIQGIDRAGDHNYGVYYDYIISQYNIQKIDLIDSILAKGKTLKDYYQTLYYNKLLDYEKLLSVTGTMDQYYMLQKSQLSYNSIIDDMELDTILPSIPKSALEVNFEGIQQTISLDTSSMQVVQLNNEIIDLRHEKEKSPSLTISGGYDISRRRPYYSVGFSTRITRNKSAHIDASVQGQTN